MKYLFISYYFPPDIGAGSFRSYTLLKTILKNTNRDDKIFVISATPNRYDIKPKGSHNKIDDKKIKFYKIKVPNHKEKIFLKSLSGLIYFLNSFILVLKIKPDICISSTARLISGLSAYLPKFILKYRYLIDLRDIFSDNVNEIFTNILFKNYLINFIRKLEKKILEGACSVNLVSKGFQNYIDKNKIKLKSATYFSNGLDQIFLKNLDKNPKRLREIKKVLYVGNIGDGQGLHKIIPNISKIESKVDFLIIGDGGKKKLLIDKINKLKLKNIKILKPMSQNKLIYYYKQADILLLHLNDYKALENVIPSKIFEYLSFNKPILCGVSGYTKKFISKFDNLFFFNSCDHLSFIKTINKIKKKLPISLKNNRSKLKKYNRNKIMNDYSKFIINLSLR